MSLGGFSCFETLEQRKKETTANKNIRNPKIIFSQKCDDINILEQWLELSGRAYACRAKLLGSWVQFPLGDGLFSSHYIPQ